MLHKSAEIGLKIFHSCNILGRFSLADMISTTTNKIFIPMDVMYLPTGMFCTLSDMTSIPVGEMHLHASTFTHMTSIFMGAIYLHARIFCTLTHTTSKPVGAMYVHARTFCTLTDMILYSFTCYI